jgi:two-component system cell cycle response regulator DivK
MERRRPRKPPLRPLVLIIERHDDTRALYAIGLAAQGFEVVAVGDDAHGAQRAWELHPDIIVTDLPTPDSDGGEFLRELKQNSRTRDIPVVAVSGYVRRSHRELAMRTGFAACFPKPCLPDRLAAGLRGVLDAPLHVQAAQG